MGVITIVYDEGGLAKVTKDKSIFTIPKAGKTALDIARKGGEGINPMTMLIDGSDVGVALVALHGSNRLSEAEKDEFRRILLSFDPILDSVHSKREQGIFLRDHKAVDGGGPPPRPIVMKFVDP